jgi:hypothetical protein
MLDHDQANDRAWDRLLEHLDTDVATIDDFEHFDASPPVPMPQAKVAAIVARATGNHRRKRRAVAGVTIAAATLLITVAIAGVKSHTSPTAAVRTHPGTMEFNPALSTNVSPDELAPAEALRILRDRNRAKAEYVAAIARATSFARESINWLRTSTRDPKAASDAAAHATAGLEALAPLLTPGHAVERVGVPRIVFLPRIDGSRPLSIADIDDVASLAAYAIASVVGFRTSDGDLADMQRVCLDKIAGYLAQ